MTKKLNQINHLLKNLDHPLFDKNIRKSFIVDLIYASSVVEGIKLTKSEVNSIVVGRKKPKNDDQLQAYGQKLALELIEKWAKQKQPVTINNLLELHQVVFEKIDTKAGQYRSNYVKLRSSALMPSFPFVISADMNDFNSWLQTAQKKIDPKNLEEIVEMVARTYHFVTKIHPFSDGNGRTARLFVNLLLRRYCLPYIIIPKVDNFQQMRTALRAADTGEMKLLIKYIETFLTDSLEFTLKYWTHKKAD